MYAWLYYSSRRGIFKSTTCRRSSKPTCSVDGCWTAIACRGAFHLCWLTPDAMTTASWLVILVCYNCEWQHNSPIVLPFGFPNVSQKTRWVWMCLGRRSSMGHACHVGGNVCLCMIRNTANGLLILFTDYQARYDFGNPTPLITQYLVNHNRLTPGTWLFGDPWVGIGKFDS
jgi:hypothetical protein